jgi:hypothetical protein
MQVDDFYLEDNQTAANKSELAQHHRTNNARSCTMTVPKLRAMHEIEVRIKKVRAR